MIIGGNIATDRESDLAITVLSNIQYVSRSMFVFVFAIVTYLGISRTDMSAGGEEVHLMFPLGTTLDRPGHKHTIQDKHAQEHWLEEHQCNNLKGKLSSVTLAYSRKGLQICPTQSTTSIQEYMYNNPMSYPGILQERATDLPNTEPHKHTGINITMAARILGSVNDSMTGTQPMDQSKQSHQGLSISHILMEYRQSRIYQSETYPQNGSIDKGVWVIKHLKDRKNSMNTIAHRRSAQSTIPDTCNSTQDGEHEHYGTQEICTVYYTGHLQLYTGRRA
ncbi:hypothetical protein MAR_013830 [Mya arenaria]|uniref:Uncharacterized protein n=1 Tax=Mya arenaria TaxID=6604 RepID=A0ABY7G4Z4_MYAAR|nr:hypothetical protein MAR_013830 [Mya arenaria]